MSARRKKRSGKTQEGGQPLPEALQALFSDAVAHHNRGNLQAAADRYSQILQQVPRHADALHLLGLVAHAGGQSEQGEQLIQQAIAIRPTAAPYHFNLGVVQQARGDCAAAADSYRQALRLDPKYVQAYENLGVALQDSGQGHAALKAYQQALALKPDSLVALKNLATLQFARGDTREALRLIERALALSPAEPELRAKRAGCLLRLGHFAEGWLDYEWRGSEPDYAHNNPARSIGLPHWAGPDCDDQSVLVSCEQGLGDEIMFAGCVPQLAATVARCALECDARLLPLFARSFPECHVLPKHQFDAADYDSHLRCGSLPRYFRQRAEDFPVHSGYLIADPALRGRWRSALQAQGGALKVGLSWRGGRDPRAQQARTIELDLWRKCFAARESTLFCLQHDADNAEIAAFNQVSATPLQRLPELDLFNDIEALAAVIAELDLVITVDNSIAHLAGALGTPVWILLPPGPEFRWLDEGETSPWYPGARLLRSAQAGREGWKALLSGLATDLSQLAPRASVELVDDVAPGLADLSAETAYNTSAQPQGGALLLNDTSDWYHWGCSGTSLALHAQLRTQFERVEGLPISLTQHLEGAPLTVDDFDSDGCYQRFAALHPQLLQKLGEAEAIFVNGEGSLHGSSPAAASLLYMMWVAATRLGKPVHLINHSCYPDGENTEGPLTALYQKIYRALTRVVIREPASFRLMRSLYIACEEGFDCLPLFIEQFMPRLPPQADKTVVLCGSVAWQGDEIEPLGEYVQGLRKRGYRVQVLIGASAFLAADDIQFVARLQQRVPEQFELVVATTERQWLGCIASASLLVSGRFHHSIAAAFVGTPFIVAHSNTPKINGLLERLAMPEALLDGDQPLLAALNRMTDARLEDRERYRLDDQRRHSLLALSRHNLRALV